jgi:hypothetical protein
LTQTPEPTTRAHLRLVPGRATKAVSPSASTTKETSKAVSADRELEWFFTMAESDMGLRSNYLHLLGEPENSMEDRAEASHAQRTMRRRLMEVGDHDAGVLQVAYRARPWPMPLRKELGRLTGVVVRLASADIGLPDDDGELDSLERRTADWLNEAVERKGKAGIERFRPKAAALLMSAFRAYVRERGGAGAPLLQGVT